MNTYAQIETQKDKNGVFQPTDVTFVLEGKVSSDFSQKTAHRNTIWVTYPREGAQDEPSN